MLKALMRRCFLFLAALQILFTPNANATIQTFAAGSYIIPMDTTYQNNGMWLSFGLMYNLLNQSTPIPIHWAIIEPKTVYGQVDFTVPTGIDLRTSVAIPPNYGYAGGPYIIDSADAPAALPLIMAWWLANGNQPVVHQATSPFIANVDLILNKAPIIAIDDENNAIAIDYMMAAQIPDANGNYNWPYTNGMGTASNPSVLNQANIVAGQLFDTTAGCPQLAYTVFITPHNGGFSPNYSLTNPANVSTIAYAQLDNFVYYGGGWVATCHSILSMENAMADLTVYGNAAVKALFKTTAATAGGLLLQSTTQPPTPDPAPDNAFPVNPQNLGTCWIVDAGQVGPPMYPNSLGLPIAQSVFGDIPTRPGGSVDTWRSPYQFLTNVPAATAPTYWPETKRIAYFDLSPAAYMCAENISLRYDHILDGVYHNGTGAGKASFLGGHHWDTSVPYTGNSDATYLRSFFNEVFINADGQAFLNLSVDPVVCASQNVDISLVNTGAGVATVTSDIVITLNANFTYVSTSFGPSPDIVAGQVLTWHNTTVPSIGIDATAFTITVSNAAPLGATQIASLSVTYSDVYGYNYTADNCMGVTVATVTTANAGPDQTKCIAGGTTSATFAGNAPGAGETGLWTQVSGPAAVITTPSSPTSTVTGLTGTNTYIFMWTITNAGATCTSSDTVTIQVNTILSPPGPISGPTTICAGSTNTYSVAAVPGATSYTWTLPGGWTGSSTTNSIMATASSTSGTISVTANNGACASTPSTLAVTVLPAPAQPGMIMGPTSICSGTTNVYSVSAVPGATSYTWTLPSGWTGSSTTNSITATASTMSGTISVTANNASCSSPPATLAVTVTTVPAQPGPISGPASVCSGSTNTYSVAAVPGATSYTWTLPAGWTGFSTTNTIIATASTTSGTISVTANAGVCSSPPSTLDVTVVIPPSQPGVISGPASVCSGSTNTYSVAAVPGATSYTWTLPAGWTGSSTTNSITTTASTTSGTISVTANNGACPSTPATLAVTVIPTPAQPGSISGPMTVCSGGNYTYSVLPVPGATSYTWTLPPGWTGFSTTNSINVVPSTSSGAISVTANNGSCTSTPATLVVMVTATPSQPGPISGPSAVCAGTTNTYSVAAVPGASSYTWTLPAGWTGSSTTNSIVATASSTSGTISVTADNGGCASTPATLAVTVTTAPAMPGAIMGPATVCSGSTDTYSVSPVPGATSYTWTLPPGWTGFSTTNSINVTPSTTSGTVSVTANNGACPSGPSTLNVMVTPTPPQPGGISGPTAICSGTTNIYSVTAVPGATSYTWTLPAGWSGSSTTNSIVATASTTSGTISVTANNGVCSSTPSNLAVLVTATPNQPGPISGPITVCSGSMDTYSVLPVPGATSYTWTLPPGWIGSSTTNSINVIPSTSSGTISVTANNGGCSSPPSTLFVTVTPTPSQPGFISGPSNVCAGSMDTYSVTPVPGATSYTWTLPAGWAGASITNSINATASSNSGTITVTADNGVCASTPSALSVTVTNPPGQPGAISGPASVCAGSTNIYSVTNVPGATSYTWTLPPGWTGTSTTNSIVATASSNGGTITVTANNGACASSPAMLPVVVIIPPSQPGAISGPSSICASSTNTYSISAVPGATSYTWTLPPGWTGSSTTNSIIATASSTGGTISVTANNGACASTPSTLAVTVIVPPPQPGTIFGPSNVCSGSTNTYFITAVPGATSYTWTLPAGWTGSSTSNSITTTATTMGGVITVTANNGSCPSTAATLPVAVTQTPDQPGAISGPSPVCAGTTNTYSVAVVPGATSYTWTLPPGWTGSSTTNAISATASATSGTISVTANNGSCSSTPQTFMVVVNPLPNVVITPASITINSGTSTTLTASGAVSYVWSPGGEMTASITVSPTMTTTYTVTGTDANGCVNTATATVTVVNAMIVANPDFGSVPDGGAGGIAVINVLANDLLNGMTPTLADVNLTPSAPFDPHLMLNPDGSVSVLPGTPGGVYTIGYTICEKVNPTNCSSTTVHVTVNDLMIQANPDSGSVPDGSMGGVAVTNVLANDFLDGVTPTLADVNLTPSGPFNPHIVLNPDGSVSALPGTPAGVYTIGYTICQKTNPTNCSSTTVQVTVGSVPIVANPNSGTVFQEFGGVAVPNVLVNDTLDGAPATLDNVSLTQISTNNPGVQLDTTTGAVNVAPGTPVGTYKLVYQICERPSMSNCATATITVHVIAGPLPPINAMVCQIKEKFATGTDIINVITWMAPTEGPVPVAYRIYRDAGLTDLLAQVPGNVFSYQDHDRKKNVTYTYYIVSVGANGNVSVPAVVTQP